MTMGGFFGKPQNDRGGPLIRPLRGHLPPEGKAEILHFVQNDKAAGAGAGAVTVTGVGVGAGAGAGAGVGAGEKGI